MSKDYCPDHIKISQDMATIKERVMSLDDKIGTSIKAIEKHISGGAAWRLSILGVAVSLLIQLGGFIYLFGQLNTRVTINTGRIDQIENLHPRVNYGK